MLCVLNCYSNLLGLARGFKMMLHFPFCVCLKSSTSTNIALIIKDKTDFSHPNKYVGGEVNRRGKTSQRQPLRMQNKTPFGLVRAPPAGTSEKEL